MAKITILCIDDQREVLTALRKDLEELASTFQIETCESAMEAREVLDDIDDNGDHLALIICDHVMPGQNGVDFLIDLYGDPCFPHKKTLLLTGLATHNDTIIAINEAHIDGYIEKPWQKEDLIRRIKVLVTQSLLEAGIDYQPCLPMLDQQTLYAILHP